MRDKSATIYKKPDKQAHKGFFYLNDETVINSLSALESGKVDEIVSKTTMAREGGFTGEARIPGTVLSAGGGKKSSTGVEEEMVRTRTRFSLFDAWYKLLKDDKALGSFEGWGKEALEGINTGDTIEVRADLSLGSLQTVLRLFLWFADQASKQGTPFTQKGDELKETKQSARMVKTLLGIGDVDEDKVPLVASPQGDEGPQIVLSVLPKWVIGRLGQLGGRFNIVAQVIQIIPEGEEHPILRLTKEVTPTPLEVKTLKDVIAPFVEPAKNLGVDMDPDESVVKGPALIVEPIAIYR